MPCFLYLQHHKFHVKVKVINVKFNNSSERQVIMAYKIGFAGTDGRTLLGAWVTSTATSEKHEDNFQGVVIRGMPAMPPYAALMKWPVEFIPTTDNSKDAYTAAIVESLKKRLHRLRPSHAGRPAV